MEDLISKRELLERYGVSYGALYRWKRMGLIPEDWFLRRATPTGQETFFHRAQICPRVEQILQRGDTSLEDLAEKLREPERQAPENWLIVTDRFTSRRFRLEELKSLDGAAQNEIHLLREQTQYRGIAELTPAVMKELIRQIVIFPENRMRIEWNFRDEIAEQKSTEISISSESA